MKAKTLMIAGSMSSVGKSLLVTALCRIYHRLGVDVAPFKAQNMSNNAAVCPRGGEIGRAQALQAVAAGLEAHVDMNPVLIKPEGDARSQVVLMGKPWATLQASAYYEKKKVLWEHVTASLDRLRTAHELIIIEGAGSAAELNLKQGDIVNMAVARYLSSPVLLVGDIDRGGIFAQLLGTLWLLEEEERRLLKGFIINKFRGDLSLFNDGIKILEEKGGIPVLGVAPYLKGLNLPDEDAVSLEEAVEESPHNRHDGTIDLVVIALPRIANFDDFDAFKAEEGVRVRYVSRSDDLGHPDAVLLPGTKNTLADLQWMKENGLADAVAAFARLGGVLVGICGGYQMLGERILDPQGIESKQGRSKGLAQLPVVTEFLTNKTTSQALARVAGGSGWLSGIRGMNLNGYEIHIGKTYTPGPWLFIHKRNGDPVEVCDGCSSPDGKVWGCYMHGLFANDGFRRAWLKSLGWRGGRFVRQDEILQESINRLADVVEESLNMDLLDDIIRRG